MAPREASNVFPDQFITLEYDANSGPGFPHEPAPPAPGDNMNIAGGLGQELGDFEHHIDQVMNGTENNEDIGGHAAANNGGIEQTSHSMEANSNSIESFGQASLNRNPVDPLSIDPTSTNENPMSMPSFRSNMAPAVSPTSTQVAPWSSSQTSSSSSPLNSSTPQNHLGNGAEPDFVDYSRRPNNLSPVSPPSVNTARRNRYLHVLNSVEGNQFSSNTETAGHDEVNHFEPSSQSHFEFQLQDHDQQSYTQLRPIAIEANDVSQNVPRRRLRRIVTNSAHDVPMDLPTSNGDEINSLPSNDDAASILYLNQEMQSNSILTENTLNSNSSHEMLSTGTELQLDSSLDSTPTRILHHGIHNLLRNDAFENSSAGNSPFTAFTTLSDFSSPSDLSTPPRNPFTSNFDAVTSQSKSNISFAFGPNTKVSDLKYFAERGCIVLLLSALNTPRLKTLGCRLLADYAKMPSRRVAVASNKRILQFVIRTIHEFCDKGTDSVGWLGREYAVETIRSLTATEESDTYLMRCGGMLNTLALCARGGPFLRKIRNGSDQEVLVGLASGRARLHSCIAIMNLSCGKSNKVEIAKIPEVLEAMRDAMLMRNPPAIQTSNQTIIMEAKRHAEEARLKATTCVKNLSNADANDAALLKCPGLIEALGHVAGVTCKSWQGSDATTTTNACLALMNLSINKANKHIVFRTRGVMDALMAVISQNENKDDSLVNVEAKVKACSALSNLAIGYDNKIPMFSYPGFVDAILHVIESDRGEARTKACSILWSFAAEMKNQVPVVKRGDILPVLVMVAEEDHQTEARFKCVAALTLLAESLENAVPLLASGALAPLMDILDEAGPDPTQWKGQTASWCVGFLMNMAQSDEAVPSLREAGVVELLAPLLTLDHYQSLKAAMAVTFVCRYDEGDETYDLLRKTETVIPKIISLLHNTLSGRGGNGYKYGVFTLRSSVGCIASLASGPDFMKERIATHPVYESLLRVLSDFCVSGGTPGAIVGGGRDDTLSPTLAVRALHELTGHLIPIPVANGDKGLPFGSPMNEKLKDALAAFAESTHVELKLKDKVLARETRNMILGYDAQPTDSQDAVMMSSIVCCSRYNSYAVCDHENCQSLFAKSGSTPNHGEIEIINALSDGSIRNDTQGENQLHINAFGEQIPVRTFLLADNRGRRFAVPIDPSGGRSFNDNRIWCYRRGRFCRQGESPDPNFVWTSDLQRAYTAALSIQGRANNRRSSEHVNVVTSHSF